jgi:hypothetical protein
VQALRRSIIQEDGEEEEEGAESESETSQETISNVPQDVTPRVHLTRSNSAHADILNFVVKQQSKAIATKDLVRHIFFTVVSFVYYYLRVKVF